MSQRRQSGKTHWVVFVEPPGCRQLRQRGGGGQSVLFLGSKSEAGPVGNPGALASQQAYDASLRAVASLFFS